MINLFSINEKRDKVSVIDTHSKGFAIKYILCLAISFLLFAFCCANSFLQFFSTLILPAFLSYIMLSKKHVPLVLCVAAALALTITTQGIEYGISVLMIPIVCAIIISKLFEDEKNSKTPAVAGCFIAYGVFFVLFFVVSGIKTNGEFSFMNIVNSSTDSILFAVSESLKIAGQPELDTVSLQSLKNLLLISFPAYCAVSLTVLSYLTVTFFGTFLRIIGCSSLISKRPWMITMSKTSTIIYVIAHIFYFITSFFQYNAVSVALMLIVFVLSPAYLVIGIRTLTDLIRARATGMKKALLILLVIIAFVFMGSIFTYLLIGIGISVSMGIHLVYNNFKRN